MSSLFISLQRERCSKSTFMFNECAIVESNASLKSIGFNSLRSKFLNKKNRIFYLNPSIFES